MANYAQLECDVKSVYGIQKDSNKYLEKFLIDYMLLENEITFFEYKFISENHLYNYNLPVILLKYLSYLSFKLGANYRQTESILKHAKKLNDLNFNNIENKKNYFFCSYYPVMCEIDIGWMQHILSKNEEEYQQANRTTLNFFNSIKFDNIGADYLKNEAEPSPKSSALGVISLIQGAHSDPCRKIILAFASPVTEENLKILDSYCNDISHFLYSYKDCEGMIGW